MFRPLMFCCQNESHKYTIEKMTPHFLLVIAGRSKYLLKFLFQVPDFTVEPFALTISLLGLLQGKEFPRIFIDKLLDKYSNPIHI